MAKARLSNDEFLTKLGNLLQKAEDKGSVFLTQKKYVESDGISAKNADTSSLLFRATDGNSDKKQKTKFSTVVSETDVEEFWAKYTEALKSGMSGLKKKEKKKKAKGKKSAGVQKK